MKVKSHAKINLVLDVLKKSGKYHRIQTVFLQIGLHDEITFKKTASPKITLRCDNPQVPLGSKNTILKAASLLKKTAGTSISAGLLITLKKNIPVSSGLGGGSSNAAATLIALNKLWRLHLSNKRLHALALKIGMDAPFFLEGGTALGTHYGEKITPLQDFPPLYIILAAPRSAPNQSASNKTKKMYGQLSAKNMGKNISLTRSLLSALKEKNAPSLRQFLHNDFEAIYEGGKTKNSAPIMKLKKNMLRTGADVVHITGSGPTLYALYKTGKAQREAFKRLKKSTGFLWKN